MDERFEIKEPLAVGGVFGNFDFDAVGIFDGGFDGFCGNEALIGKISGGF